MRRLYQIVICLQIARQFDGTPINVIVIFYIKILAFSASIFTKITNAHQYYTHVQNSCTEFCPNQQINVRSAVLNGSDDGVCNVR
jgi:ribosome modulation factor